MQCNNNLKQIGLASLNHESGNMRFPSGGWTYLYVGDPNFGFGRRQPGSWAYSLLPFLEQNALYQLGMSSDSTLTSLVQRDTKECVTTPLSPFICPSRRTAKTFPIIATYMNSNFSGSEVAKSDYAACYGSTSMKVKNNGTYTTNKIYVKNIRNTATGEDIPTGIIFDCSETRMGEVRDGTTNTYLVGEKFVYADKYEIAGEGDNRTLYAGINEGITNCNFRSAGAYTTSSFSQSNGSITVNGTAYIPMQDRSSTSTNTGTNPHFSFGSAHAGGFGMAMADGSVHSITYSIDGAIHAYLANRKDNMPAQIPE